MSTAVDTWVDHAVERPEIHWPGYLTSTALMLVVVGLLYLLMRRAWQRRGARQSDLPPPAEIPGEPGQPQLTATGRYHGSTSAGEWLDRVIAHGLGTRSQAEVSLCPAGLAVVRPGARDFFVPAAALRGARLDKAIAGKVLTEGGLLVVTWEHGGRLLDSGFRFDNASEHSAWVTAVAARIEGAETAAAVGAGAPLHEEGTS